MRILSSQIPGLGLGKKELVPTINLKIPQIFVVPFGIYVAYAYLKTEGDMQRLRAIVHYGPRPVLNDVSLSLEVHILGETVLPKYDKDHIEIEIIQKIRNIMPFSSLVQLREQIRKDILSAQAVFDTLI